MATSKLKPEKKFLLKHKGHHFFFLLFEQELAATGQKHAWANTLNRITHVSAATKVRRTAKNILMECQGIINIARPQEEGSHLSEALGGIQKYECNNWPVDEMREMSLSCWRVNEIKKKGGRGDL